MNIATAKNRNQPLRVLLDTNIIISAVAFGGLPAQIFKTVIRGEITGITSNILVIEALEVFRKKLKFTPNKVEAFRHIMRQHFLIVHPKHKLSIVQDEPDNRVLEAAITGHCRYIVTGDKELLSLQKYKSTGITTPKQFLDIPINYQQK